MVLACCLQLIPHHTSALLVLVWSAHMLFKRQMIQHHWDRPSANIKGPVSCQPCFALVPTKLLKRVNTNLVVNFLNFFFLAVGFHTKLNNSGPSSTLQRIFVCLSVCLLLFSSHSKQDRNRPCKRNKLLLDLNGAERRDGISNKDGKKPSLKNKPSCQRIYWISPLKQKDLLQ